MSALPLHAPVLKLASTSVPAPLRRFFEQARLAELPASVSDLHFDTDATPGVEKTLLAFRADRAEVNLFVLLSGGLRDVYPSRLEDELDFGDFSDEHEPDFPWWRPDPDGPGRRYVFNTTEFDFVEVVIEDLSDKVFIRAIR
jgi:hypothetical protein